MADAMPDGSGHVLLFAVTRTIGWPVEIWAGAIVFASLAAAGIGHLATSEA